MNFQLQKRVSRAFGINSYVFTGPSYSVTVHTVEDDNGEKVQYPVKAFVIGDNILMMPDLIGSSKGRWELSLPPSIPISQLPDFQACLEKLPEVIEDLKEILELVETGTWRDKEYLASKV